MFQNIDVLSEVFAKHKQDEQDRSNWLQVALTTHPAIAELRDRIYPLQRATEFAKLFDAGKSDVKQQLSDDHVNNIILQHLIYEGLKKTKSAMEEELGVECTVQCKDLLFL